MKNKIKYGVSLLNASLPLPFRLVRPYLDSLRQAIKAGADGVQGLPLRGCDESEDPHWLLSFEGVWRPDASGLQESFRAALRERSKDPLLQWIFFADEPKRAKILESWRYKGTLEIVDKFGPNAQYVELSDWINVDSLDELLNSEKTVGSEFVFDAGHWFMELRKGRKTFLPTDLETCLTFLDKVADRLSRVIHVKPTSDMEGFLKDWRLTPTGEATFRAMQIIKKNARKNLYGDDDIITILEFNPGIRGMFDTSYMHDRMSRLIAICKDIANSA